MKELPDSNPPKDQVVRKGSDVNIGTQSEEEGMQKNQFMETSEYAKAWIWRVYDPKIGGSEAEALIKKWVCWIELDGQSIKDWFTENQIMFKITSEPDGWVSRKQLMIANSHNILNQGTQQDSDKDVNEGYMEFTMMQTDKNFKSKSL